MRFLTEEEIKAWCEARGLRVTAARYLRYEPESWHCFAVGLEDKPSRAIALAVFLTPSWDDVPFEGALFWVGERDV